MSSFLHHYRHNTSAAWHSKYLQLINQRLLPSGARRRSGTDTRFYHPATLAISSARIAIGPDIENIVSSRPSPSPHSHHQRYQVPKLSEVDVNVHHYDIFYRQSSYTASVIIQQATNGAIGVVSRQQNTNLSPPLVMRNPAPQLSPAARSPPKSCHFQPYYYPSPRTCLPALHLSY